MNFSNIQRNSSRRRFDAAFHNRSEAEHWMLNINGPHVLDLARPSNLSFRHQGAMLGDFVIGFIEYSTSARIKINDLDQSYSISLPLSGEQMIELQHENFVSNSSIGAIISPQQSTCMSMSDNCRKRMVKLSRQAIENKVSKMLGRQVSSPVVFEARMPLEGTTRQWWKMVANLQDMLGDQTSLCDLPQVWESLEDSLITSLLFSQPHNYSNEILDRQAGRPAYLTNLEALMKKSLHRPLGLADLEKAAGVSRDRLYKDFHLHFQMSPIAYFRQLRFEHVQQRLAHARPTESVSSIAMDYGFQQFGYFAKEYKERFGESPSQTLRSRNAKAS